MRLLFRCEARGSPQPTITWLKDGQQVARKGSSSPMTQTPAPQVTTAPTDPNSHRVLLPAGHLFFLRAVRGKREDDRGTYWCRYKKAFELVQHHLETFSFQSFKC